VTADDETARYREAAQLALEQLDSPTETKAGSEHDGALSALTDERGPGGHRGLFHPRTVSPPGGSNRGRAPAGCGLGPAVSSR
jgi:hypothetical protein